MTKSDPANDTVDLATWRVPPQPAWVFEVDGNMFENLVAAEKFSGYTGKPIYCHVRGYAKWQWGKARRAGNE